MGDFGIGELIATIASFAAEFAGYSAEVYSIATAALEGILATGVLTGLGAVAKAMSPSPSQNLHDRLYMIRAATVPHKIIYGKVRSSGVLVFCNTSGVNNRNLDMVVALAGHQVESIGTIYLNETPLCDPALFASPLYNRLQSTPYAYGDIVVSQVAPLPGAKVYQRTDVAWTPYTGHPQPALKDTNCWTLIGDAKYFTEDPTYTNVYPNYNSGTAYTSGDYVVYSGVQYRCILDTTAGIVPTNDTYWTPTGDPDTEITGYTYNPVVTINKHLGADDQTADTDLITNCPDYWTSAHRLRGIAYLYIRLTYSQNIWTSGIPNISAIVEGKNDIYDPRTETYGYTDNWALCLADYINSPIGLNASWSTEIDLDAAIAAANSADESVDIDLVGGTQARFTCNGVIDTSQTPLEILTSLSTAGAGNVIWTAGVYRILAGVYVTPSWTLDESDLRDALGVVPGPSKKDIYNGVKGTFCDPLNSWQPNNYPQMQPSVWVTADGGSYIQQIDMQFTTDVFEAQRTALLILSKSRQGTVVTFPAKFTAFPINVGDVIYLNISLLGYTNKVFRVINWKLGKDGQGVDLTLQSEYSGSYTNDPSGLTQTSGGPDTNLPTPWNILPVSDIAAVESLNTLTLSWQSNDAQAVKFNIYTKPPGAADFALDGFSVGDAYVINNPILGRWGFRITALNTSGVESQPASFYYTVVGYSAMPDVTGLFEYAVNNQTHIAWDAIVDARAFVYEVRLGAVFSTATILNTTTITDQIITANGKYWVTAKFGSVYSSTPASITVADCIIPTTPTGPITPDAPTGLTATGAFATILLSWTAPAGTPANEIDHYEIWRRATTNNISGAILCGTTSGTIYSDTPPSLATSVVYYYWVRAISITQTAGAYNAGATSGTSASTANDPSYLLSILTGQLSASQLDAGLNADISQIFGVFTQTYGAQYSASTTYAIKAVVLHDNYAYQNNTGSTVGPEAWNAAHWTQITSGLYAQYMVKLDVNGYVSGFGMANDGATSTFEILADKFVIAPTAKAPSTSYPFFVLTSSSTVTVGGVSVTLPAGVYMNTAFIGDATIKAAHIGSLNADVINAGTLNGSLINVTNLNADNIVTGTITVKSTKAPWTPENSMTMIRGRINDDGTIEAGTGFTVSRIATGKYTITFNTAFSAIPTVVFTVTKDATFASISESVSVPITTSTITANIYYGGYVNRDFSFIAIGPT